MEFLKKVFSSEIRQVNELEHTLVAAVSTSGRDRMDEVLLAEGVDLKQFKKNPVVLFAHNYKQPPIAKALWIKRDGDAIVSKMKFAETPFAQEVFNLYKDGFMKAFSVGFISKEHKYGKGPQDPSVTYLKWEMLEYSAVPVPANPEALALAMKKGVLKDKGLKTMLEEKPVRKGKKKEAGKQGENDYCECGTKEGCVSYESDLSKTFCLNCNKEVATTSGSATSTTVITKVEPNPELLADIALLKAQNHMLTEENANLKNAIFDLRYQLLQKETTKPATLSEISDGAILKKIEDVAVGVIRKVTGKVN